MKDTARTCHICGGGDFTAATAHYDRCRSCGHELLSVSGAEVHIINDHLDRGDLEKRNALDRFKTKVLRQCVLSSAFLLDVGSASGRFIHQHRHDFEQSMGLEVTPECIAFSRDLGLHIEQDLAALEHTVSTVTFWHSLEHIPAASQGELLKRIKERSDASTVVLVSVPNAESLQYRLLGARFAFYDVPAHLHQFTIGSLDTLMRRYGFEPASSHPSLPYAGFGWMQGLLNLVNTRHNYYYYRTKRGWDFGLSPVRRFFLDGYNLLLMVALAGPAAVLTLLDIVFPRYGGVVTRCYHTKTHST